jgi:uncharacterized short protein YbdD (DUF466 family)
VITEETIIEKEATEPAIAMVGVEQYDNEVEDFVHNLTKTPYDIISTINTEFAGEEGRMREYASRKLLAICFDYYKYTQAGNPPINFITDLLSTEDMFEVIVGERYRSEDGVPECYGDYMVEFSGKFVEWLYDEKTGLMPRLSRERNDY